MAHDNHHDHDHDEAHSHDHGHDHGHSHAPASFGRAFAIGIVLNTVFVIVETVYGLLSHSLALVADAGHNLSDVLGLFLAWGATVLAKRAATERHTYGFKRSSVLAALGNAIVLLVSVGAIAWEAVQRLRMPDHVGAQTVIWVALLGILINAGTAVLFMSGRKGDLNVRGAYVHMLADAAISAGVVIAGIVIAFTGWFWLDPAVSLVVAAIIIYGTWDLLRESINLSLDAVPEGIDATAVSTYLRSLPGVCNAHHLHIWGLSTTEAALTVHLVLTNPTQGDTLLREINATLRERFRIGHATIQFESAATGACETADHP
ncbi:MAG TPA: cation diffusion facilitator family transporter [Chthoniobacter sp.]|nr:cation diffusion facilitator family transporter [Chthoniobacter sp.]